MSADPAALETLRLQLAAEEAGALPGLENPRPLEAGAVRSGPKPRFGAEGEAGEQHRPSHETPEARHHSPAARARQRMAAGHDQRLARVRAQRGELPYAVQCAGADSKTGGRCGALVSPRYDGGNDRCRFHRRSQSPGKGEAATMAAA